METLVDLKSLGFNASWKYLFIWSKRQKLALCKRQMYPNTNICCKSTIVFKNKHCFKINYKLNTMGMVMQTWENLKRKHLTKTWVYTAHVLSHTSHFPALCIWRDYFLVPFVRVQSAAVSMAFSSGSPTSCPSSIVTSEWQVATTLCVSTGISDTGITSFPSLS